MRLTHAATEPLAKALVEYAKNDTPADEPEFVIPEDLSTLDDEALSALAEEAVGHFDTLYGDGTGLSSEDLDTLATLTEGIETVNAEVAARQAAAAEREQAAQELAARVRPADENAAETVTDEEGNAAPAVDEDGFLIDEDGNQVLGEDGNPVKPEDASPAEVDAADAEATTPEAVTASATPKRERRISLSGVRSRQQHRPAPSTTPASMKDVVFASGEGLGYAVGQGMNWSDIGRAVDRRLTSFNQSQYENASRRGRHLREQHSLVAFKRSVPDDLTVHSGDPQHVDEVIARAVDEARLPGGSLVASGGWCAPSETLYDLCGENESRDGLLNVPEIGVSRGGIQWTTGPSFADIYNDINGFHFTEEDDEAGNYGPPDTEGGPNTAGDKPCYKIDCPPFEEARLEGDGLCLTAGLLQSRGYPEVIARVTRGALVAHDHKVSANQIQQMVAGSTAVTMPAGQAGATAPLLAAIELQVEHYRYSQRMGRSTTLEAIFPYWVRGVVRQDLSVRLGVENFLAVTDTQIDAWFRSRGVNPQFVYDWQDITGDASAFTTWPTTVDFLLYAAGTWVRGVSDIITLDTIYDSVLLGQNDYTALFTEEAYLMAKRCHDSRVVTVSLCGDGATHGGVDIACDLTVAAAAA